MSDTINTFFKSTFLKRLLLYGIIALLLYELRSFTNLFLMIFFVTYIMNELCKFIHRQISRVAKVSEEIIIMITYALIILLLVLAGMKYVPQVIDQTRILSKSIDASTDLNKSVNTYVNNAINSINPSLKSIIESYDFDFSEKINKFSEGIVTFSYNFLKSIGIWILNIFLIIILSFFFLIEKNQMKDFIEIFKEGRANFIFNDLKPLFVRFYRAFGAIIKAQFIIALINTALTITALAFLKFSNLFALAVMLFLLSLIPVAGAIFSTIPLILIGFGIGGLPYVLYVLAIVIVIHSVGIYLIFPKILSNFTHMPIFITLVVLLLSEHLFGPWGLIYGLPLFVFIVESVKQSDSPEALTDDKHVKNAKTKKSSS